MPPTVGKAALTFSGFAEYGSPFHVDFVRSLRSVFQKLFQSGSDLPAFFFSIRPSNTSGSSVVLFS
jgi:hypothetical protein